MDLHAFEWTFPVLGGQLAVPKKKVVLFPNNVYGTAIYLEHNRFLTAGNVLQDAIGHEQFGLGYNIGSEWHSAPIIRHELHPEHDIGIFEASVPGAKAWQWEFSEQALLSAVQTIGYPHVPDLSRSVPNMRAFRGYVVSTFTSTALRAEPRCYELSFACPRGLLGAPLFTVNRNPKLTGLLIGNKAAQLLVYCDREGKADTPEGGELRYDTLPLGVALQTSALKGLVSPLLGGTAWEYLTKNSLVSVSRAPDAPPPEAI